MEAARRYEITGWNTTRPGTVTTTTAYYELQPTADRAGSDAAKLDTLIKTVPNQIIIYVCAVYNNNIVLVPTCVYVCVVDYTRTANQRVSRNSGILLYYIIL